MRLSLILFFSSAALVVADVSVPLTPAARATLGSTTAAAAVQEVCAQQHLALRWQPAAQAYDAVPRDAAYASAWRASCAALRAALPPSAVPANAQCLRLSTGVVALESPGAKTTGAGWQIVTANAPTDLEGLAVEEYLGDYAWLVHMRNGDSLARVRDVAALLPCHKVAPALFDPTAYMLGDDPEYRMIDVHGFHATSVHELENAVRACGGEIFSTVQVIPAVVCRVPLDAIATLAARDDVKWIGKSLPALGPYNNNSRAVLGANTAQAAPYNYRGTNIEVLVYDVGMANFHQDFTNRTIYLEKTGADQHSTHVAGTVLGDGRESGGTYRGMAPEARLISYAYHFSSPVFYNNPGDLETNYFVAINTCGADLANNSIGINMAEEWYYGDYETSSILIDQIARGRLGKPFLSVWAAGNARATTNDYAIITPPQTAKNSLVVGGTQRSSNQPYNKTSCGPVGDGRLKPDLAAPAVSVNSCDPGGGYVSMSGTSFASPAACGCAALLLQCWRSLYSGDPSPAMFKAILINATLDLGAPGPGFDLGYGLLQLVPALNTVRAGNMLEASVAQSILRRFPIIVPATAAFVRATIAWSDPPGSPLATKVLVNDLDLCLVDPAGRVFLPWVLDPNNPAQPATTNFPDRLNNVEQVLATNLAPGVWYAEVRGALIAMGPTQTFALAANYLLRDVSSAGTIRFDAPAYRAPAVAQIELRDLDLTNQSSYPLLVRSVIEPAGESIICTQVAPGLLIGTIPLATVAPAADGLLSVANGALVSVAYVDASNGAGGVNITNTAIALIDLTPPLISGVAVTELTDNDATIRWQTDEDAYGDVRIVAPTALSNQTSASTQHAAMFNNLTPTTAYAYVIIARDLSGNVVTNDNEGILFTFTTRRFQTLWHSTAEIGAAFGWSSTGAWHQSSRRPLDGSNSWYCGNESAGIYDPGLDTALVSIAITVTSANASLRFREFFATRIALDWCYVQAATNTALTWFDLRDPVGGTNAARDVVIPLNPRAPKILRLRFNFKSTPGGTGMEGWYLDNLRVGVCVDNDLAINSVQVTDPLPGGNANSFIEPGETIALRTVVFNGRSDALTNLNGTLSCSAPYAAMLNGTYNFGTRAAGTTFSNTGPFTCAIATNALPGSPLSFVLACSADAGIVVSNQFMLTVVPEPGMLIIFNLLFVVCFKRQFVSNANNKKC